MRRAIWIIAVLVFALPAHATDLTVSRFQSTKGQAFVVAYINGLGQGYLYANTLLLSEGRPRMYCQPMGLTLIGTNYVQLIETELQRPSMGRTYAPNNSVEVVLLNALRANFPCGK